MIDTPRMTMMLQCQNRKVKKSNKEEERKERKEERRGKKRKGFPYLLFFSLLQRN